MPVTVSIAAPSIRSFGSSRLLIIFSRRDSFRCPEGSLRRMETSFSKDNLLFLFIYNYMKFTAILFREYVFADHRFRFPALCADLVGIFDFLPRGFYFCGIVSVDHCKCLSLFYKITVLFL